MSEKIKIIIDEDNDGDRLDTAVSDNIENISRARCQKLIKEGAVWLNGIKVEKTSKTVANAINLALHKNLTFEKIESFVE